LNQRRSYHWNLRILEYRCFQSIIRSSGKLAGCFLIVLSTLIVVPEANAKICDFSSLGLGFFTSTFGIQWTGGRFSYFRELKLAEDCDLFFEVGGGAQSWATAYVSARYSDTVILGFVAASWSGPYPPASLCLSWFFPCRSGNLKVYTNPALKDTLGNYATVGFSQLGNKPPDPPGCSYQVFGFSKTFESTGLDSAANHREITINFSITHKDVGSLCPWKVFASPLDSNREAPSWFHWKTATEGTGEGFINVPSPQSVTFWVDPNPNQQLRSVDIYVVGQAFTITQNGRSTKCDVTYDQLPFLSFAHDGTSLDPTGPNLNVKIENFTDSSCSVAVSGNWWISIAGGAPRVIPGHQTVPFTLRFLISPNDKCSAREENLYVQVDGRPWPLPFRVYQKEIPLLPSGVCAPNLKVNVPGPAKFRIKTQNQIIGTGVRG